jgi:osmotically-inducible protein OsmY
MNRTLLLLCTALAATACERSSEESRSPSASSTPASSTPATSPSPSLANQPSPGAAEQRVPVSGSDDRAADNTGRNERDREGSTATSGDQGGTEADRSITQKVRQAVVDDEQLSATAKNVKIITKEGVVTLRGPVKSSQEKSQIASAAQRVDGVKRIDNQLEVTTK